MVVGWSLSEEPRVAAAKRPRLARAEGDEGASRLGAFLEQIQANACLLAVNIREEGALGRGILLWLLGVPIPIIILISLLYH